MPSHVARLALTIAVALALPATASADPGKSSRPVCPGAAAPGNAECHAKVVTDRSGNAAVTATPAGYGPADLRAAYNLPSATNGAGQTIAIVDAYDAPTAENDMNAYRSQFGIAACTTASGCFKKVNQNGLTTSLPKANGGWAQEISLDLDMASAICPNCHILLVEAASSSLANLGTAVNTAAGLGATVISNSYGGGEYSSETADELRYYNHPGIPVTVSSGDSGYGVEFPAASQYVTAVGGTSLTRSATGFAEKAWSGAGSGCSAYVAKPTWQSTATGCARRALADVSAVADPNTGVAVYDSTRYQGASGWMVFGGTSVAAPVVAGVYALAGNGTTIDGSYAYAHTGSLNDVTTGSNGTCPVAQWCTAGAGWDGPTGLGTPNGIGGF